MANDTLSPSSYADLVELGRRLYERALVRREQELITDPRGQPIGWLLDTRIPMLDGALFREVGEVLAARLRARGLHQVAGFGFGAYALVCSVLAAPGTPRFTGGFIREKRKPHGRRRLVEGPLDRTRPVVLLDDILNSGRSATRALALLRGDGFEVCGLMTLFNFTWSGGRARLEAQGLWVDTLLDLNLRESSRSSSDSPY
ncbi:orotate phosphoribosyltransferase [Rhodocaloribacter litoris]|uniref:orotate phosphoribosyltransferase n=1 Tax=Rhodocaloribacter litoris TaxID=2558931 RepID=UPI00141F9AD4|nr:orotate phosphoribosyltransferase [Rhodocaloribacter litoris]QXD17038.1 orotate phosphoribosyltransferase [Rhodocaloribacter litoris]GIV60047.1 MAG: orotate phosphoribosyltransferase [Rhodothermaceae bacterium]